ncbi:hypothetical protein [Candidatus Chlamydia sanziniae]|uniref:Uncharacterized protein n=1 Tax=Candidatus Chlamydia sanziniae TaxID=1806891 RepID=A0A1A9HVS1_9CHLA|nr:hypothetical protein [Candidatus Chlamydia sanziniae]ANH79110.1 hypothetical protein Cs308_0940 [Candidatus Chlamydia sanziniae]
MGCLNATAVRLWFQTLQLSSVNNEEISTSSRLKKVLKITFCVLLVLSGILFLGTSITGMVLLATGFPFWLVTTILCSLGAATISLLLLATLIFKCVPNFLEPKTPKIEQKIPHRCAINLEELYHPATTILPENIEIPGARDILIYSLKFLPQIKLITAQISNFPTIRDHSKGVHTLFFLHPKTGPKDKNIPSITLLRQLEVHLQKGTLAAAKESMNTQKQPGLWKLFPWLNRDPQEVSPSGIILLWTPWDYYPEDLQKIKNQHPGEIYYPLFLQDSTLLFNFKFLTNLLFDFMAAGIHKIHIHAPTIFAPQRPNGYSIYGYQNFLRPVLLSALSTAAKKAAINTKTSPSSLPPSSKLEHETGITEEEKKLLKLDPNLSPEVKKALRKALKEGFYLYITDNTKNPMKN